MSDNPFDDIRRKMEIRQQEPRNHYTTDTAQRDDYYSRMELFKTTHGQMIEDVLNLLKQAVDPTWKIRSPTASFGSHMSGPIWELTYKSYKEVGSGPSGGTVEVYIPRVQVQVVIDETFEPLSIRCATEIWWEKPKRGLLFGHNGKEMYKNRRDCNFDREALIHTLHQYF